MGRLRFRAPWGALGEGVSWVVLGLGMSAAACTGVFDGASPPMGGEGATSSVGGSSGSSAGVGATGGTAQAQLSGYKPIHRLTTQEYNATVADVLGTTLQPGKPNWSSYQAKGFDNIAAVQRVDGIQYQRYFDAAEELAAEALGRADFKGKFVVCATSDDACVSSIVAKLGLYLFRRPLATTEVANYRNVYLAAQDQGESHEGALQQVLRALLLSSEFLYRMEFDANPASPERHALSAYELASRLSYFLWSSAPDDALLQSAEDGSLTQDATLSRTIERLLADPVRSQRFVENFSGQWLGTRTIASHPVAAQVYPDWNQSLSTALTNEMYAYFADFLHSDRSWLEFLTADQNFVDATTATFYGMPAPSGPGLEKRQVTTDQRVGFLGLGGFLALSSLDRRTSPTLRGRWIMINLLCTEPPPPPPKVPDLADSAPTDLSTGNIREALARHREKGSDCATCHKLFDPYGLPLEQFDGIGAYRQTYADGSAIVPDAELIDGTQVKTLSELANALTLSPQFSKCAAESMLTYGLGRVIPKEEHGAVDALASTWSASGSVPSLERLIETIALDPSFRSRSGLAE